MPRFLSLLALALALLSPRALHAHPDHNATRRGVVEPVPSTRPAPEGASVAITIEGERRIIVSNGLPDHPTLVFKPSAAEAWQGDVRSRWHHDALDGAFPLGPRFSRGAPDPGFDRLTGPRP